jgi:cellulose biosynthesis protein BcsQ
MAVVAIYSTKGGVGKTTIATALAWCSSQTSCRHTLLWDLDPSGGSAFLLNVGTPTKEQAAAIFAKRLEPQKMALPTRWAKLDLLPADESLRALDAQLVSLGKRKRLANITGRLSKRYERILLDCPPVLNEVSAQAMRAADLVIVPLTPSPLSARALSQVVEAVRGSGKRHPPILPVLSMLDLRRTLHREARDANPNWPALPLASAIEQGAVRQEPVAEFAPRSPAARAFAQLWTAIERKLAQRGN